MSKMSTCKICVQQFKISAGSKGIYCSKLCYKLDQSNVEKAKADIKRKLAEEKYLSDAKLCQNCSIPLKFINKSNKFCSRSCVAIYGNKNRIYTSEFKEKLRKYARENKRINTNKGKRLVEYVTRICPTCNKKFELVPSCIRKFCSPPCVKTGGIREGSGRAKTGYYKGIYCGSTYELSFLIWHLDHNKDIQRCNKSFTYTFQGKKHRYYPDFEVDSKIIEVKGRVQDVDFIKIQAASATMLYDDLIMPYIQYVIEKYNVKKTKLYTLYDSIGSNSTDKA